MKRLLVLVFSFSLIAMIGSPSYGYDKSPPGVEQVQKTEVEKMMNFPAVEMAQYQIPNSPGENIQAPAESIVISGPPLAIEEATLKYCKGKNHLPTYRSLLFKQHKPPSLE